MNNFSIFWVRLQDYSWAGNTAGDYLVAAAVFVAIWLAAKIFQVLIVARLEKLARQTSIKFDDLLLGVVKDIKSFFYFFLSLYFAARYLNLSEMLDNLVYVLLLGAVVYQVVRAFLSVFDYYAGEFMEKKGNGSSRAMMRILKIAVQFGLWAVAILLILSNLGVNVTSLIASLGLGGIAVALAVQNILTDIFSSFSLYLDRPFETGDFIKIGNDMGTVQNIGLKTTRVRTLLGDELIIPNRELTGSRVQNFKRMQRRRELFTLGVVYETPKEKLEKIPVIIKDIINNVEHAEFDRCHFSAYGDFSLNFETVYFIDEPDYNLYMDVKQKVNLEIFAAFAREGIEFAYPTQLVYVKK